MSNVCLEHARRARHPQEAINKSEAATFNILPNTVLACVTQYQS
ncbi:hypothetical protein [Shewanella sp. VB17]|nr:hypothetical protein [Shewanella sp. VB17]